MLAALIPAIAPLVERLVGLIPDAGARERARAEMTTQLLEAFAKADQAQLEINREEARSASLFVAGWRPFIGWVCGAALAYQYIARPALTGLFDALGLAQAPVLIGLDDNLWQLMLAMLGMGGLRTFEKLRGLG
jgi:hypothetical protein